MDDREQKIQQLKDYFEKRSDVAMAFLFGSQAEERAHGGSDWDIAVYFTPATKELEYEDAEREYPEEDRVWSDLMNILKTDNVDFLVLNRAPANIAATAIRGVPLAIKNRGLWLKFMLVVTGIAEDFRITARDYYEIFQRSRSLLPDDAERLSAIITFIKSQTDLYSYFADIDRDIFVNDVHKRMETERWVETIINSVIDIAKIVLASSHKPTPPAYREIMAQGALMLGLGEETATLFEKWVRLRNVLAHEYLDIKWKRISNFISTSQPYMQRFVEAVEQFLKDTDRI